VGLVIGLALGAVYLLKAARIYQVEAQVLLREVIAPTDDPEPTRARGSEFLATQAELMRSPVVVGRALESSGVAPVSQEDPVRAAQEGLVVTPIKGTRIISISYRDEDRSRAPAFIEALVQSYEGYARELDRGEHGQSVALLRETETELKERLTALEQQYQELRSQSGSLGVGRDALTVQKGKLEQHSERLARANHRRIELQNRLRALDGNDQLAGQGPDSAGSDSGSVRAALQETKTELARLAPTRSSRHPDVAILQGRIASLERELASASQTERALLARELQTARRDEARIQALFDQELQRGKDLDSKSLQEAELRGEIERIAALYASANRRLRSSELTVRALETNNAGLTATLLSEPSAPDDPIWPRPTLVLVPFAFLGLLLGFGAALLVAGRRRATIEADAPIPVRTERNEGPQLASGTTALVSK
jgi:uncharacterized protein involved in exopolysaccharide biosynthesis